MALTKVTFSMIEGAAVNAIDFGFSTSETAANNATAIVAAMDSVPDGGTVWIPNGVYDVGAFYIRPGILLAGESKRDVILKPTAATGAFSVGLTQPYSRLENLTIDGTNSTGYGVLIDGPKTNSMQHVLIKNFTGATASIDGVGLVLQSTNSHSIRDCEITGNKTNVLLNNDGGEVNQIIFDNCTIEYSTSEGVIIERGVGITFLSCSFGHHGAAPSYAGTAIKVNDTNATVEVLSTWFEFCAYGVDFAGSMFTGDLMHCPCRLSFMSGRAMVSRSEFFGLGGYVEAPVSSTANVTVDQCLQKDGYTLVVDNANAVGYASRNRRQFYTGQLTPETSGSITVFASEDQILETFDGNNVTVNGRLSVQSIASPVGTFVKFELNTPCLALTENADYAAANCIFFDASLGTRTVVPAWVFGGLDYVIIWMDASTIQNNDTFTLSVTYPV